MIDLAVVMGVRIKNVHSFFDEKQTIKYQQIHYTVSNMCKNECRWDSLKEGINLYISLISEKVNILNFFSSNT